MKVRSGLLLTCATGSLLIGLGTITTGALAADMVTKAEPLVDAGWWYHGYIEAGGRGFLNNPQRNGQWSAGQDSLAKYYEYSTIKPGPFLDGWASAGSKDGKYQVDLWAKNVGYDDQRYEASLSKAGEHYLNLGWDQTPHLYSTSAQTLYNGVGTNHLTLPAGLSATLEGLTGNANPLGAVAAGNVRTLINNSVHQTDVGIRRDTASVEYRYTPTDAWDIRANYSDMKRSGTQIDGVTFSWGTSGVVSQVTKPVNDRTQNYGASGEYAGTSFWGQKFNTKVAYNGSTFSNDFTNYTVENPFCSAAQTIAGSCDRTSAPVAMMSMWPGNQMNSFTGTLGADLPWKSRYMGTLSYGMIRQNDAFLPFTINTALAALPAGSLPAASLNGATNTFLSNNVLTSQLTSDLKSKLSYRYYNYDNQTPELYIRNYVGADIARVGTDISFPAGSYPGQTGLQPSYTRQNAAAELNWRPSRQWNLGAGYTFERYDHTRADVNYTNENSAKLYVDYKPISGVTARGSYQFSARRYGTYDNLDYVALLMFPNVGPYTGNSQTSGWIQSQAYRQFQYANRDRNQGKFSVAWDVVPTVTITPTAGFKYDDYLNNRTFGNLLTGPCAGGSPNCIYAGNYNIALDPTQPGLKKDNSWNLGAELSVVASSDLTFMLAYTREYRDQEILRCNGSFTGATTQSCNVWSGLTGSTGTGAPSSSQDARMQDAVDTVIARMKYWAIADRLMFDLGYTYSKSNTSTALNPGPFASLSGGAVTLVASPFPDMTNRYQRLDAITTYKFADEFVHQLGWKGTVTAKVRYAWERNRVTNWQNDTMQTYMWAVNNSALGYMTWLAGVNPNYDVQLIAGSIGFQW